MKIWLDGDGEHPTLCGTGTEDYIGTGWGRASTPTAPGLPTRAAKRRRYCFYRWHVADPVYFGNDIRVAMQQIGSWRPHVKDLMAKSRRPILARGRR